MPPVVSVVDTQLVEQLHNTGFKAAYPPVKCAGPTHHWSPLHFEDRGVLEGVVMFALATRYLLHLHRYWDESFALTLGPVALAACSRFAVSARPAHEPTFPDRLPPTVVC